MKILVTGPGGFVGRKLMEGLPGAVAAPSLRGMTEDALKALLDSVQADVIIHTAAVSDMGQCEADPEGSYRANVVLPELLAKANRGAKLVAFSSDQVYNGSSLEGPFTEADLRPANTYARQKAEMEARVLDADANAVLLRAEWMYDYVAPKGNFLLNTLRAEGPIVTSSRNFRGVTYVKEVVEAMEAVCRLPGGAYNFGSETDRPMLEVTRAFLEMTGKDNPLADNGYSRNLWMDCSKARQQGVDFSPVVKGLRRCLEDYGLV